MAELVKEIAGGWLRAGLVALSTYLVQHHLVTAEQGARLVGELFSYGIALAPGAIAMLWTSVQKYRARVKLLTALTLEPGATEDQVKRRIDNGLGVSIRSAAVLLACALVAGAAVSLPACAASTSSYHVAVVADEAYAQAVFAVQDAELANHRAHLVTDEKHAAYKQTIAKLLRAGDAVTLALQHWQPGTPVPTVIAGVFKDSSALLEDVSKLFPQTDPFVQRIRDVLALLERFGLIAASPEVDRG